MSSSSASSRCLIAIQEKGNQNYGTIRCEDNVGSSGDVDTIENGRSSAAGLSETPVGVQEMEAIALTWTKWSLIFAYLGLYLLAFCTSLESSTTVNLTAYATSSFGAHSLVSTVSVIQAVSYSVIKPLIAKIADCFGRLEAFCLCVLLLVTGYIQQATSGSVQAYGIAAIFYAAGSTGLQILQQIFVADTSSLLNRAIFSTIPNLPYVLTTWIGSMIAQKFVHGAGWRWGYGIWGIVLPAAFIPLALSLFLNKRKAQKMGLLSRSSARQQSPVQTLRRLWFKLDVFGLVLLLAAAYLVLVPVTLASTAKSGWSSPSIIAMLVAGSICALAFFFWERSTHLAPHAFFPRSLLQSRTVLAGTAIAFFYFMSYYLSVFPYYYSYLLVVSHTSITTAGRLTQLFTFTSSLTALCISLAIQRTARYKPFVALGATIYVLGLTLMLHYRHEGASTITLAATQICVGIGGGMLTVPVQLGIQASVPHSQVAAATAVFLAILEIGGAVGAAVSGAVWTHLLLPKLAQYLPEAGLEPALAGRIYADVGLAADYARFPPGSRGRGAINRSYQETMDVLLGIAVAVAVVLLPLSLCMEECDLRREDRMAKAGMGDGLGTLAGGREVRRKETLGPRKAAVNIYRKALLWISTWRRREEQE